MGSALWASFRGQRQKGRGLGSYAPTWPCRCALSLEERERPRESGPVANTPDTQGLQPLCGMLWGPHGNGVQAPEGRVPHDVSTNRGPSTKQGGESQAWARCHAPQDTQGQRCSVFLHPEYLGQGPGEAPENETGKNCSSADRGPRNNQRGREESLQRSLHM